VVVTASIGITNFPDDAEDAETLIRYADIAMYHAKEQGKNDYEFYSPSLNATSHERLALEAQLRKAVERDELLLHYQPLVETVTGRIVGAEALIRWLHPQLGLMPPAQFIPLAEETGLIGTLGEWVLETACRQMQAWNSAYDKDLKIAVNLSSQHFRTPDLDARIARILHDSGLLSSRLEIELTETTLLQAEESATRILNAIHSMGTRIALDDFGTGYSSLSYLRRFPIDRIKIDRSFVRDIPTDEDDRVLVQAIVQLARALEITVVAEGVETTAQRDFLRSVGCDALQGYLVSPAAPAEEFARIVDARPGDAVAPVAGRGPSTLVPATA
jgi:predicted signal transduction protein with EAL and GGDEF domain